jgi:hypothetical protein
MGDAGMDGLKVWQRLGVVATIFWVLGAGYTQYRRDTDDAAQRAQTQFQICSDGVEIHHANNFKGCLDEARNIREAANKSLPGDIALAALAPPLLTWMLVYLSLMVARWVLAGRSNP